MNRLPGNKKTDFRILPLLMGLASLTIGMIMLIFIYDQTFLLFFIFLFFGMEWVIRSNIHRIIAKRLGINKKKPRNHHP